MWLSSVRRMLFGCAAALCLGGAAEASGERMALPERLIPEVVRILENEAVPERVRAAMELARLGTPDAAALDALKAHLDDQAPAVRSACLYALGELGHRPSLPWILDRLNDSDPQVRVAACHAVGRAKLGGYARLPFADQAATVRLAAYQALETVPFGKAVETKLQRRLEDEGEADLRAQLFRLYRLQKRSLSAAVLKRALTEGAGVERIEALRWLAARDPQAVAPDWMESVFAQRRSQAAALRAAALRTVAVHNPEGGRAWVLGLAEDPDHTVRKAVAKALGDYAGEAGVEEALKRLQRDDNGEVRRMASMMLAAQAGGASSPALETHAAGLCRSERAALRREGLWLLGQLRSQAGFPHILSLARRDFPAPEDEDAEFDGGDLRETRLVVWVVQRSGYEPALPLTVPWFLQLRDRATQFHAANAIGRNRYRPGFPALIEGVTKTKTVMGVTFFVYTGVGRRAALEALASVGSEKALDAMVAILRMTEPQDTRANVALMVRALAANGRKQQALRHLLAIMETRGIRNDQSPLAAVYRELTGKKVPEQYRPKPFRQYNSDLLTPR